MPWFDCAIRRPIGTNTGGSLGPNLGLILHHQAGNGSLYNFFNNPASQVSAHFWVSKTGLIEQYVDTTVVAWHAMQLNGRYNGVETEGCATPPYAEPLTDAQINALATLYAEGMRRHGWHNALANADGQPGFGFHRMAVATGCPCDIRISARPTILAKASGTSPTPPSKKDEPTMWTLMDPESGGTWVLDVSGAIFAYDDAPYLGGCNNPKYNALNWPAAGISNYEDSKGSGYVITLDAGTVGGDRFRRYRFPRDGSSRV